MTDLPNNSEDNQIPNPNIDPGRVLDGESSPVDSSKPDQPATEPGSAPPTCPMCGAQGRLDNGACSSCGEILDPTLAALPTKEKLPLPQVFFKGWRTLTTHWKPLFLATLVLMIVTFASNEIRSTIVVTMVRIVSPHQEQMPPDLSPMERAIFNLQEQIKISRRPEVFAIRLVFGFLFEHFPISFVNLSRMQLILWLMRGRKPAWFEPGFGGRDIGRGLIGAAMYASVIAVVTATFHCWGLTEPIVRNVLALAVVVTFVDLRLGLRDSFIRGFSMAKRNIVTLLVISCILFVPSSPRFIWLEIEFAIDLHSWASPLITDVLVAIFSVFTPCYVDCSWAVVHDHEMGLFASPTEDAAAKVARDAEGS